MTHKVHPIAYRLRRVDDWSTRGFYKNPAKLLEEDYKIRVFLNEKIEKFGVEKIEIERFPGKVNIIIFSSRPGLIIGRGGEGIEKLRKELMKEVLKREPEEKKETAGSKEEKEKNQDVKIEIREIKDYWTSAKLTGQWIASRLQRRLPYRKVLKQSLSKIMSVKGIQGARVELSGRLNGAEIARREWVAEGKLPRQTIRADIDYALTEAHCSYGVIGVKIWIYKGEKFEK